MEDREESVQHFLDLIKRSRRGKFKIYIGMIAGVCTKSNPFRAVEKKMPKMPMR